MVCIRDSAANPARHARLLGRARWWAFGIFVFVAAGVVGQGSSVAAGGRGRPAAASVSLNSVSSAPGGSNAAGVRALAGKPQDYGLRTLTAGADILALAARISTSDGTTFLTIDLSAAVSASAFVLNDPQRIIVEMPETRFHIDDAKGRLAHAEGLIAGYRFGQFAAGRSRIVIDLAGPARIAKIACERIAAGEPSRLVIALESDSSANFAAGAAKSALAEVKAAAKRKPTVVKAQSTTRQIIVLDPGHGGMDSGAAAQAGGALVLEKTIVFEFARSLAEKLEASQRYKVLLTRDTDIFSPLDERVRFARENHAALFISIHADTLSDSAEVSGATVYTMAERASDTESARVAEKENGADMVAGVAGGAEVGDVSDILFDLTRRETRTYSHVFAHQLTGVLAVATRLNKNPERAASFRVLRAPDVPSVLLELGYLSNDRDVRSLISPEWRERTATSVVRAVDQFFAPRLAADADELPNVDPVATGSIGPHVPQAPQPDAN